MKKLYCEIMPKLNFYFDEKECNIKYNETIFNGIPNPKNIEIKDITYNRINISWEIGNANNIDINKIKYIIELRKDNEKFNKVYEGNNKNSLIEYYLIQIMNLE
jgi:hypothetical protein